MKFILITSLCFFLGSSVCGQIAGGEKASVNITEISLAKDDGKGSVGEIAESFFTTDTPIHFLIRLDSVESITVKMNLVAVKAAGLKPETKSVNVSYTTDGSQNQVNFDASPGGVWAAGKYRADIYINNKLIESRAFDIEKSPSQIEPPKPLPTKTFAPRRKTRKN